MDASAAARVYCCEANAGEPMLGTADVVDVWLLLEYRAAWRARAWTDNDLSAAVRDWLAQGVADMQAQGLKVRPQFIRQPESDRSDLRLMLHHGGVLRILASGRNGYRDLLGTPIEALLAGAEGEALEQPQYFVCTNGRRDLCCARFGLPVYHGLRALVGGRAWQITHLGGHRFAPNVLVLPQGVLYGRVQAQAGDGAGDGLAGFVAQVEAGLVAVPHLRGRACLPKPAQAAEGFAGGDGLAFLGIDGDERRASVTFAKDGERLRVRVAQADAPHKVLASCGDDALKEAWPYRLLG